MKTIEILPFAKNLCPLFNEEQREYYRVMAQSMINSVKAVPLTEANDSTMVVDKGYCLVVKVAANQTHNIPATVIPIKAGMEEFFIYEYSPRPIDCTNEYPYPTRFLPQKTAEMMEWAEPANFMHCILYSKEQLKKEDMEIDSDYGLVTINAEFSLKETPIAPHSLIRNVDTKYGGNGEWEFNHDELAESFRFYSRHIRIK